jgi:acyl-CoA synthetase (NDP forming)
MLSEPDVRDIFQAHHVPVFDAATDACFKMLRAYIDYGKFLQRHPAATKDGASASTARPAAQAILRAHSAVPMLPQAATTELLGLYNFKCAESIAAFTGDDAEGAATKLGYPVIAKAMVPNIAHRSDAGLVSGKVSDVVELRRAFSMLQIQARSFAKNNVAVSVEKFVPHDFEVILGVKYDATFGPVILCGLGGIFTEVLNDYALRLAPLTQMDAEDTLSSLKAFPVLRKSSAHLKSLTDALLRLSDLAVDLNGQINAVDINPIGLSTDSSETTVLDGKIHLREIVEG